ncbi:hypothetical protein [Candidatus Contubernalis alkaliaceticus]|uniref:hypothetical protein n=1 Tax=Candidatus Contubernalis alkaliaceticus TaxID=338645 RepID=UPI001F4BF0B2|nr:hypothetical protein [Candidatus Contubernalis alkalaceticus]UNC91149.1 hypothetical protein HUE98_03035 [Candidatus Contubernalis alkalaceticus]
MTFTNLAVNKRNSFVVKKRPGEIVCIMVDKIYRCYRKKQLINLQWNYPCCSENSSLPQEILSCEVKEVRVKECRVIPLRSRRLISFEVCYLVKVEVVFLDHGGNKRVELLQKEVHRHLGPVPGAPTLNGLAEVSLDLLHSKVDTFCGKTTG